MREAPSTTLDILHYIPRIGIQFSNDAILSAKLAFLAHFRIVGKVGLFYKHFRCLCLNELQIIQTSQGVSYVNKKFETIHSVPL